MGVDFFMPRISADTKGFWDACKEHKLKLQKCSACGKLRWPAAYLCPDCLSDAFESAEVKPEGVVESFVVFQKPFHPSLEQKVPYITATVNLQGGARIVTNLVHCNAAEVSCGAKVRLVWSEEDGFSRPTFELIREEEK